MADESLHPDVAQLLAFDQGRLEDEAASAEIAAHLDTCAACQGTLESFADDTLENLVRTADWVLQASEPVPETLEYFRIERVLGQGGMGTVYVADDTRLHRQVAVKMLKPALAERPDAKDRFLREARAGAALQHEHIVPIYYVGEANGTPFLAMPLLKGMSLDAYLKQSGGKLPLPLCVDIAQQIARGLEAAHERGLIHRDIKPSNIWLEVVPGRLNSPYRVKILDFGLAQIETDDTQLTLLGYILGTPAYMSPEQARGEKVDGRSDLWSLGVILYLMATGRQPFTGKTTLGVLTSIAVDQPVPPAERSADCSPALSNLVMSLLEKDPSKRPASATAVIDALANLEPDPQAIATQRASVDAGRHAGNTASPRPMEQTAVLLERPALKEPSNSWIPSLMARPANSGSLYARLLIAVALIGCPLAWVFGGTVIRFATNQGTLVIDIRDKDVDVRIKHGRAIVQERTSDRKFILTARDGEIEVLEKDGIKLTTKKFVLTRGGTETVTVTLDELASARKTRQQNAGDSIAKARETKDPDRGAAEYVLTVGGIIRINGETIDIRDVNQLPKEPFRITAVNISGLPRVGDAGLVCFQNCRHVTELDMQGAGVSDNGLVYFKNCKKLTKLFLTCGTVTDAGLAYFQDCKRLSQLYLGGTSVTDKGLAWFKDCDLTYLYLGTTAVTDAGLAHFQGCQNLTHLTLGNRVTDAGVANFQNCKNLTQLHLLGGQVTDAGLAGFTDCHKITDLYLYSLPATDAGLAAFQDCKNLSELRLNGTAVSGVFLSQLPHRKKLKTLDLFNTKLTDTELIHVGGCTSLKKLDLSTTAVTDAGLKSLESLTGLRELNLVETMVTFDAITRLQEKLPDCHIIWNDPDRRAAEYVLSVGGTIRIHGSGHDARRITELPKAPFRLADVNLNGCQKVTDAGLAHFASCRDITSLDLQFTPMTDAGAAHFKHCKELKYLDLRLSNISDAGTVHFQGCTKLKSLFLSNTNLTDAAMVNFKDCKQLTILRMGGIRLTDAGLASFQGCDELTLLDMEVAAITDAGLSNFKNCKKLQTIWLNSTPVTDVGFANFKDCKDLTFVNLQLTQVSDATVNLFAACRNLTDLRLEATFATDLGLRNLERLSKLQRLDLQQTQVTQAGVKRLQQLLPNCTIKWGENLDPDRRTAQYVFYVGGTIRIDDEPRDLNSGDQLTPKPFRITSVSFRDNQRVADGGMGSLKGCTRLAVLDLQNTPLTDAGLVHFQGCKTLQVLDLSRTRVTNTGVANLRESKNLEVLGLARTGVTDACIPTLETLTELIHLDLTQTKVTPEGFARLKKSLPKCKILCDGMSASEKNSDG